MGRRASSFRTTEALSWRFEERKPSEIPSRSRSVSAFLLLEATTAVRLRLCSQLEALRPGRGKSGMMCAVDARSEKRPAAPCCEMRKKESDSPFTALTSVRALL